ncbi:hypothetical protein [Nocardia sp. CNY236]|uniref:hypothetical protein n=1 Tax=Nocardia sp. CNY236 TaxID=1169152 RepID=UPI0003FF34C7|nr:hypothetical protein [Nocardia sp. CNY236]
MRRVGEWVDAMTAFIAAVVAGLTLFLPVTVIDTRNTATPYQVAGLLNSLPRNAAMAMIVTVTVAVLVGVSARPVVGWAAAALAMLVVLISHLLAPQTLTAEMLTTQNYIDAMGAAVVLGALGGVLLHRPVPGIAFAVGSVGFLAFGDVAALLRLPLDPTSLPNTPPQWLAGIAVTTALLAFGTLRNWSQTNPTKSPGIAFSLPVRPILAATLLAATMLAGTTWLSHEYEMGPTDSHAIEVVAFVAATIVSATIAALLLPGRDGAGIYLAVSFAAMVAAVNYPAQPGWGAVMLLVLTTLGIRFGSRRPSVALAVVPIAGIAVFARFAAPITSPVVSGALSVVVALAAGYCCGTARPRFASSGVLAITTLYLPTVISVMPTEIDTLNTDARVPNSAPGRAAIAITVGCAIGLTILHKIRQNGTPGTEQQPHHTESDHTESDRVGYEHDLRTDR